MQTWFMAHLSKSLLAGIYQAVIISHMGCVCSALSRGPAPGTLSWVQESLTGVGEDMSLQFVWPIELFTAARVCPRTQNLWSGGLTRLGTLAGLRASLGPEGLPVYPKDQARKQAGELGRQARLTVGQRKEGLQNPT